MVVALELEIKDLEIKDAERTIIYYLKNISIRVTVDITLFFVLEPQY